MLDFTESSDKAISFGTDAGLKNCKIISHEIIDEEHHFIVEGQFGELPDSASDNDRSALENTLRDPWQMKIVVRDGHVIRNSLINVFFSF